MAALPEVGSIVFVNTLDKYRTKMIASGALYTEKPPKTEENSDADLNQDGKNSLRFIKSRSGYQIIIDDTEGKEKVQILSPDNALKLVRP
jgi:hypothetical protein